MEHLPPVDRERPLFDVAELLEPAEQHRRCLLDCLVRH
jgi:hypothetical protein